MKRTLSTTAVAVFVLVTALYPLFTHAEETGTVVWRIGSVEIDGATPEQEKVIRSKMTLKGPGWKRYIPWDKLPTFQEENLQYDTDLIIRLYQRWGYYESSVNIDVDRDEEKHRVKLHVKIEPGPPTLIKSVDVQGMESLDEADREKIRSLIELKPGKIFNQEDYETSRRKVTDYLGNHGFAKADVDWKAVVSRKTRSATVRLTVIPGEKYRFGKITVDGLRNIDPKVVKAKVTFKEGELYNADKVKESQRQIFGLGPFNLVVVDLGTPEPERPDSLPVTIETKPRKPRDVTFGIGYGTEDKLRASVAWSHYNFLGQARNLSVEAKYSSLVESLAATFKQPYFYHDRQFLQDQLGYRKDELVSFTNEQLFNDLTVTRLFGKHLSLGVGHTLEYNNPTNVQADTAFELSQRGEKYFISTGKTFLQYDNRDNVLNPVKGYFFRFEADVAAEALGSELGYLRLTSEARHYWKLPRKMVLASKLVLSTIEATEGATDVPIFKRFFSGGTMSVRGYGFQELGPRDSNDNPIGGDTLLEGSVELRYPVWRDLGGVAFVDFGQVDPSPYTVNFGDVRFTAGVGIRYTTPIGPVRVDFGYQLNPEYDNNSHYQIHFSIGQAF